VEHLAKSVLTQAARRRSLLAWLGPCRVEWFLELGGQPVRGGEGLGLSIWNGQGLLSCTEALCRRSGRLMFAAGGVISSLCERAKGLVEDDSRAFISDHRIVLRHGQGRPDCELDI
jgi:hypothetical protein